VVGQNVSVATTNVQNAGFTPSIINVTNPKPAGTVIAQNPQPGQKADQGSTITLKVSQGPGNTTVPSVVGIPQDKAARKLGRAHLKVSGIQTEPSTRIAPGDATRTDPRAGQQEPVGSSVTLFISSGPPKVPVPDVTGQSESNARSTLEHDGFVVSTTHQVSSTDAAGTVINQSPAANSTEARGSTVTLTVAQAPSLVSVPNVKGDTEAAATSALAAAGFQVSKATQTVSQQGKDGIVLSQSPGGGSKAKKGSTVTIVVGHFKAKPPPTTTQTTPTTTTSPTTTSST
jgi:eukaryotic-like serine/threonine-protein kinase